MTFTADEILDVLQGQQTQECLFFRELRLGTGYGGISERRIDLMEIETAPSKGYKATVYEVKVSRSDFQREMKAPKKQRAARLFCDFFYYATPPGLLKIEEIPDWAGLIEVTPMVDGQRSHRDILVLAPRLDKERPTWGLLISAARNAASDRIRGRGVPF